ncbi:MAG TPA: PQQ-binding-like beta-propeller repeat protein [Polyangiaceae bacterium]|nr:PQQ-binding-like beta-propeller repeat protein [Polyangiaceae bacterium]
MNSLACKVKNLVFPPGKVLAFATLGLATSWLAAVSTPSVATELDAYLARMAPAVVVSVALGVFFSRRGSSLIAKVAVASFGWWAGAPDPQGGWSGFAGVVGAAFEGLMTAAGPPSEGALAGLLSALVGPFESFVWGVSYALCSAPALLVTASLFALAERGRRPSLVASAYGRLGWALTLAACLGLVWWRGQLMLGQTHPRAALVVASVLTLALGALQLASFAALRTLFQWLAGVERRPDLEPGPGAEVCDLGVGEGYWAEAPPGATPYRRGRGGARVVRGSARGAQGLLAGAALLHAVLLTGGLALVAGVLEQWHMMRAAMRAAFPQGVPTATGTVPAPPPEPPPFVWYGEPEATPLVVDVNGDRVEDVVGLRRDGRSDDAPPTLAAIDGQTFAELWQAPLRAKPGGRRVRLLRSGASLFASDREGRLHVYDLASGRERVDPVAVSDELGACAAEKGAPRVWLPDDAAGKLGRLVTAEGRATESGRPPWCAAVDPVTAKPRCGEGAEGVCASRHRPSSNDSTFAGPASYEDGKVGLSFGQVAAPHGLGFAHLVGFDPATGARRWEERLVGHGEMWYAPDSNVTLGGGRVFATWRSSNHVWKVRALDGLTGDELWSVELHDSERSDKAKLVAATEGRVYVLVDGQLRVLDARSHELLGASP